MNFKLFLVTFLLLTKRRLPKCPLSPPPSHPDPWNENQKKPLKWAWTCDFSSSTHEYLIPRSLSNVQCFSTVRKYSKLFSSLFSLIKYLFCFFSAQGDLWRPLSLLFIPQDWHRKKKKEKRFNGMEGGQCFYLNKSECRHHKGKCTIRTALVQC